MNHQDEPRPLIEHLLELRSTLLSGFMYIIAGMSVTLFFCDEILHFLLKPLQQDRYMVYTCITEPITTELRVSFYSSLLISFPLLVRKIWNFVKIGLKKSEIFMIRKYFLGIIVLFLLGTIFGYYAAVPKIVESLKSWSFSQDAQFLPRISENVSFVLIIILSSGLSFQIPIFMTICDKLNVIRMTQQKKYWREFIASITIISAIIAPPDAISMLFMAAPLSILYFGTVFIHECIFWLKTRAGRV